MGKFKLAVFATLIAVGVLATAALASTKTSTIALKSTAVGKVLVGANGRTLYLFTADKGTKSACYGQCASYWPPLIAGKPTAGTGLNASMLGTTKRKDGKLQVTYHGHPLYFFLPGQEGRRRQRPGLRSLRRDLVGRFGCGRENHDKAVNGCSVLPAWGAGGTEMRLTFEEAVRRTPGRNTTAAPSTARSAPSSPCRVGRAFGAALGADERCFGRNAVQLYARLNEHGRAGCVRTE